MRALLFSLMTTLLLTGTALAYEVVTLDGRVHETESVQFAGDACLITEAGSVEQIPSGEVDYYRTFRRNAESGQGNLVVFRTGAYFRFETMEIQHGRVTLGLGEQGQVSVPEQVIDFEQSVREGATIRLPGEATGVEVRKPTRSRALTVRGGGGGGAGESEPVEVGQDDGGRPEPGTRARKPGRVGGRRAGLGTAASRREASLQGIEESIRDQDYDRPENPDEGEPDSVVNREEDDSPTRPSRSGMADPDEVRRQAEEAGQPSGTASVIVSSTDSVDVAGVQFRLKYPENCSPAGAAPIGAFANSSMAQPNGSVGGRSLFAMAIVYAANETTSLPGEIARVDFTWVGSEPNPEDFAIVSASASDEKGVASRGFRAVATLLR